MSPEDAMDLAVDDAVSDVKDARLGIGPYADDVKPERQPCATCGTTALAQVECTSCNLPACNGADCLVRGECENCAPAWHQAARRARAEAL